MVYFCDIDVGSLSTVLRIHGIEIKEIAKNHPIPYSYWGAPEAGRKSNKLYIRHDTPVHSILHETCHFVCMPKNQLRDDRVDASGSPAAENACCYLQILISDHVHGFNREIHMKNMDEWGYSFRLGSAAAWFSQDAEDAKEWLVSQNIIDLLGDITWKLRE